MSCFCALLAGKRKNPKITNKFAYARKASGNDCPKVKPVEFVEKTDTVAVVRGSDDVVQACDKKATAFRATGLAWQGRDEDRDKATLKRDMADVDVVAGGADSSGYSSDGVDKDTSSGAPEASESSAGPVVAPAASSRLERSCSNIETARSGSNNAFDLPAKSLSYGDLKALPAGRATSTGVAPGASPTASVRTSYSADHVMLKKRSSSQVLPSRSRKLWWRLFMWSHRNLHRPGAAIPALPSADTDDVPHHHDGGYTSDTLGAGTATADAKKKAIAVEQDPIPNQWVAFSAEASSLDRVSAWVNSLGDGSFQANEEDIAESHDDGEHCTEITELSAVVGKSHAQARRRAPGEAIKTDSIIQTLNAFSSVAHISGMGLNAVPMISAFSSLRAVNLSGNFIVCISPGSLPKGLHSLDLSRNRIATIEGLRELTRLRVLNLSYNRIPRFGHGLSSCTSIRELYIGGNKMSDVEGLHRLLKLAVLDLSFNKITTTKALGQLVANYNSLRALNLLGNPVQANMGDDALRKAVSGLLPRMEYLNKQAVKPQRAREAAKDSVAKAALGNGGWSSRKRASRRLSQSPGSLAIAKSRGREGSRSRSRPQGQGSSNLARI